MFDTYAIFKCFDEYFTQLNLKLENIIVGIIAVRFGFDLFQIHVHVTNNYLFQFCCQWIKNYLPECCYLEIHSN